MAKLSGIFLLCLISVSLACAGGVIDMTEDTDPTSDDIVYIINDPSGTPGDRKVSLGNLSKGMDVIEASDWPSGLDMTELGYVNGVTSAIQTQIDGKSSTSHTTVGHTDWPATVDVTELGYLNGVSSAIQTQIDGKSSTSHNHNAVDLTDWPSGLDATELGYVNGVTSAIQTQIDGKSETSHNHNAVDLTDWPSGLDATELSYVNGVTSAIQTQLDGLIPESTITAAGDIIVGTGSGTYTVIPKGANNTFFGIGSDGTQGYHDKITLILTASPTDDDTYSGTIITLVAGEALSQWDHVYCKNKSGVHACYKYDANGTDKTEPPVYMLTTAGGLAADASGVFLVEGTVRNDGWAMTTNQDEGKLIYADPATAGGITLTRPTSSGDMVAILGNVLEQNRIHFHPCLVLVEVP